MGPVSMDWYIKNGFTEPRTIQHPEGHDILIDHITQRWAGGRLDVYGTGEPYPDEISVPIMSEADWYSFSKWLETYQSEKVDTLEILVALYEKDNPAINWWK